MPLIILPFTIAYAQATVITLFQNTYLHSNPVR